MTTTRLICCSLILLSIHGITYSQSNRTGTYTVLVTPQASLVPIGADALASGDASVAEMGLATAAFTNPAGMQFKSITAYAEFGKYAPSAWAADFEYNGQFVAPSFVSLGMPLGDFSLSVSYSRQYSNRMMSEPIPVTNISFPDGTGEFVRYERSVELHSLCASASIALNDMVSFGLSLGGNYFTHDEDLSNFSVSGRDKGIFLMSGADITLNDQVTIGIVGRYSWSMEYVPVTNPQLQTTLIDTIGLVRLIPVENPPVEVRFPPICEIGVSYQVLPQLRVLASAEFQNWTSALRDAENRWQLHLGGVVDMNEAISFRFGYFTLSNPTRYNRDVLDQNFITAGLQLKIAPVSVSLAFMDSHLFKKALPPGNTTFFDETFGQTYFSSGIAFEF